jgi:predicted secreted protein
MIDLDALRQLAADLNTKVDACYLDSTESEGRGDQAEVSFCEGKVLAFAFAAARIREILADAEAT